MNIDMQKNFVFGIGGITGFRGQGLKSTQQKQQRQSERDSQVAFFENQKQNLKNMECGSLEEISRKLDMLHSYEDQIAEAKAKYNREQMHHVLDEAREMGEKMAEAAKKYAPKTPEERNAENIEEERKDQMPGTEEQESGLLDLLEETVTEELEETTEELTEDVKELQEAKEAAREQEKQEETEAAAQAVSGPEEEYERLHPYQRFDLYV